MKEFEVNGVQYMAVEVPRDATEWRITGNFLQMWPYRYGIMQKMLPAGTWEIVGLLRELGDSPLNGLLWSNEEHAWVTLQSHYNLNDNSLIIKKI